MKKGYIYIALTTIIFSTMEIALKLVAGAFNPIQLTCTRFLIGGLFLIPFALNTLHKNKTKILLKDLGFFAFLGLLGIVISMGLYQLAVQNTAASVVAVLFSCNPVFVTILAFFILKESIKKNNVLALILEIIGSIIIINPMNTYLKPLGIIFTIASTITFALYGVSGKKKCAKYGGVVVTCFGFLFGSLEMLILIGMTHIQGISSMLISHNLKLFANIPLLTGYSLKTLPIALYIFIINTGVGFACYFKAMEETSAHETSLVFFFKPILAPILSLIILSENIPVNMVIGILFILAGSMSSILPNLIGERKNKQLDDYDDEIELKEEAK